MGDAIISWFSTCLPDVPTKNLVIKGLFCYTRNPMLLACWSNILSIFFIFNSTFVLIYFCLFSFITTFYIIFIEELELEETFKNEYKIYQENVPRFIPRLTKFENKTFACYF